MNREDRRLCLQDPLLFIDLLQTSALSWQRYFSFIRQLHQNLNGDAKADYLRYDKQIIDRANIYLETIIEFTDGRKNLN